MYYDRGESLSCGRDDCGPGCECERYLEFWNLVFMEYELHPDGSLTPLPKQNVDTGMGLERMAVIKQGATGVFETDLYAPLITRATELTGATYGGSYGEEAGPDVSLRVIAEHARTATFLIADGVLPAKEGRGYVLRRLMRRAVVQGRRIGIEPRVPEQ
jgi:alanyl-tRNA synthetase